MIYYCYGDNMAKKKISKAYKNRLIVFGTLSLVCIIYCIGYVAYNIYTIHSLNNEKNALEVEYAKLQEEAENLKIDIEKLNDKNYLANYAREHYLYSKAGEYILKIDDINSKKEEIDEDLNRQYIFLGLSSIMVLIFIYIIVKSHRSKKKKRKK